MKKVIIVLMIAAVSTGSMYAQAQNAGAKMNVNISFTEYVNSYVVPRVTEWEERGEFERADAYNMRVNEETRNKKIEELRKEALSKIKESIAKNVDWKNLEIDGKYDTENEGFYIKCSQFGNFVIKVPYGTDGADAKAFKTNFASVQVINPDFYFTKDNKVRLDKLTFKTPAGKTYTYNSNDEHKYETLAVTHNFEPIKVAIDAKEDKGEIAKNEKRITVGKSDVDINIPETGINNENTYVVIIANENYQEDGIAKVHFAINDGEKFKEYCIKTFGIPVKNVHIKPDATLNHIGKAMKWLSERSEMAEKYNKEMNVIFFYSGHGTHDTKSKSACLLPVDAMPNDESAAYKLDDLYKNLGTLNAKNVTVFLDACYSGAGKDGKMMAQAKAVRETVEYGKPTKNTVVFASSQGDQTSFFYDEKEHGMFTYFLLKKIQETKGDINLGELSRYVEKNVEITSSDVKGIRQTPQILSSEDIIAKWKTIKLK